MNRNEKFNVGQVSPHKVTILLRNEPSHDEWKQIHAWMEDHELDRVDYRIAA